MLKTKRDERSYRCLSPLINNDFLLFIDEFVFYLCTERRRREAIAAATCLTEALVDHLNVGVAQAYVNQRKLDHEVKTLQVQASQFSKQTAQWISMVEGFNQALKEIGDVENWARSIEMDMRTIATALEYVHKGQLQTASS
ncbi:biogenesis of lysosome-related organelles complex 1 subunit 1 isoform X1 [Xyrichtys novacula]|uniref:Biogenesis of lysosome-related organelles complex 1 subunit 1 n=1 Tax=Xyrichtys novacula TaxID=13765 RepID=A0AAV1ENI7_XYRNO|nr:biogenesis of lysosome-related organelles complex 1 subunit 1 isoform X1 [Xyrichtys novacula]